MDKVSKSLYRVMLRTSKTFDNYNFNISLANIIRNSWKYPINNDELYHKINTGFQCLRHINTNKEFVKNFLTYNENFLHNTIDKKMIKYVYSKNNFHVYEYDILGIEKKTNTIIYK